MNTKILIIEDDREVVETVSMIFKIQWPEVTLIHSYLGLPGIEMVKSEKPDAVILDLGLPDISGFKVLKEIRLFSTIPVIILTAHTAEDETIKALEEEATDYVVKPFRHRELVARVQSHINRWKTNEIRTILQRDMNRMDN